MTAVKKDLYIEQGATFRLGFNWHQAGPEDAYGNPTPGTAYDLTGAIVRMQIRKSQQSAALVDASTTNGKIVTGGTNGRIDVVLTDDDTDLLTSASAKYDLEVEMPNGDVYRLLEGSVEVSPNITQEATDPVVGS